VWLRVTKRPSQACRPRPGESSLRRTRIRKRRVLATQATSTTTYLLIQMITLFDDLRSRGIIAIQELCDSAREESLHLEYKQLADQSSHTFTREDKKRIAKALCGLANADGGVLLIGIASRKEDDLDVADRVVPLSRAATLKNRLVSFLPELLGPQHPGIEVEFLPTGGSGSEGAIAVYVPLSDRRPHMSVPEQRYFRRGSQGTAVMLHGEIRDLMMASREGALELTVQAESGMIIGGTNFAMHVVLGLKNVGQVAVRAPFIRIKGAPLELHPESQTAFMIRSRADGERGFAAGSNFVLHVDDEVKIARIPSGIRFFGSAASSPVQHASDVAAGNSEESFQIFEFSIGSIGAANVPDQQFTLDISYGGENVQIQRETNRFFGRKELFHLFRPFIR
jgi:hypothetical protein